MMKNRPMTPELLARRIDCALGRRPCELRLTNLRMLDVMNGRIIENAEIFDFELSPGDVELLKKLIAEQVSVYRRTNIVNIPFR